MTYFYFLACSEDADCDFDDSLKFCNTQTGGCVGKILKNVN